ncbi:hypothetical protein [Streptomyces sp. NPDC090053]|uniref:hypothetical protein n=1 Tax=Streptomyces sp. NPDC090053 TaxID=3365932 RepID=UPI00382264C4
MPRTAQPRRLLKATYDVKEEWNRALLEEFGPGGLLARESPEFQKEHLLWAMVQLRCVNGRTGEMFTGDTTIGQMLGYNTKDLPGKRCRETLTRFGFFTQHGKAGRAARLRLSAPLAVLENSETLANSAFGDVLTVADTKPPTARRNAVSRPAHASVNGSAEICPAHPEGDCPEPNDPFAGTVPWGTEICVLLHA